MTPELHQSRFLRAARREPTDTIPIWIMRQAGRYLPEYRAVRSKVQFIELCKRPELAAEVTLSAQRALGVDAAILFADLLPILEPMGFQLEYTPGDGPAIHNPVRTRDDLARVHELRDVDELGFVLDTIRLVRKDLPADIPLLGFAGAPFTLASYAIEGGGSRDFARTKRIMYGCPELWDGLLRRLADSLVRYLGRQIEAGCQAVQIFDSWAGCLSPADYRDYALPYTKSVFDRLPPGVPTIHFLTGNPALLGLQRQAGGSIIGLDWRVELGEAWQTVGYDVAVQGNLDPVALQADLPTLKTKAKAVLEAAAGRPGHIFNLGHGVLPETDPNNVKALVALVHELGTCRR
ncbi:MAG TPA: uroporphyrinogen decarboxylase [Planctomycetaceae bacterium]|jgi:uroporphyrinogen decarboxylase|nr:uroporphyrinogen decarboxylase [Planctomycetaceae bacterium]